MITQEELREADEALAKKYCHLNEYIVEEFTVGGGCFYGEGHPDFCYRALYAAFEIPLTPDYKTASFIPPSSRIKFNRISPALREECCPQMTSNKALCIREELEQPTGSNYEVCPAIHAAEQIMFEPGSIWVEGGIRLHSMKWHYISPEAPYPCLRCLSWAAHREVEALAYLNFPHYPDDFLEGQVRWCSVTHHANFILERQIAFHRGTA